MRPEIRNFPALMAAMATVVFLLASGAGGAEAAGRADLKVSAASAPLYAQQGGVLPVSVTVSRSGASAKATKARIHLSKDSKRGKGDIRLKPDLSVPALAGGKKKATVERNLTVPAGVAARKYRLLACADGPDSVRERNEKNNCRDAGPLTVTAPQDAVGTADLIEADLAKGVLSEPQALVFRVLAFFEKPGVPAKYRGDTAAEGDHAVFRILADVWPTVPAELRAKVAPLLAPPAQSPEDPAPTPEQGADVGGAGQDPLECAIAGYAKFDWNAIPVAGGQVIVHWDPADGVGEAAKEIAGYAETAWEHHLRVMGRAPLSDANVPCFHGPDGALDIYIEPNVPNGVGLTVPSALSTTYTPDCNGMPSFILVEPKGTRDLSLRFTVAHEMFHAFQNAFVQKGGCRDHRWFDEGSANWAAHGTFPGDQSEHLFSFSLMFPDSDLAIQDYHTWVFALWMEKTLGEGSIRSVYAHGETKPSIQAINAALGSWRTRFLDFARNAWNASPVQSFVEWDSFPKRPYSQASGKIIEGNLFLAGKKKRTAYLPTSISPRARNYHPFAVTDPKLREIVFRNAFSSNPDYRVGAILTLADGSTRFDDWSGRSTVRYCRDDPADDIAKLVVVSGNSAMNKPFAGGSIEGSPELGLSDSCEDFPWRFEVLAGGLELDTTASMPASGQHICGTIAGLPIGGTREFSVSTSTPLIDPENVVVKQSNGSLRGSIYTRGSGGWFDTLEGCENLFETPQKCNTTRDQPLSGTWQIGASVTAASEDAKTAVLRWAIPDPDVGFFDADEEVCYVFEIWKALDNDEDRQEIPMAKLKSGDPVTVTLEGNGSWTADQRGEPAQIHANWMTTLTIRRVDEDGNPL